MQHDTIEYGTVRYDTVRYRSIRYDTKPVIIEDAYDGLAR